jgi:hypothetical protein
VNSNPVSGIAPDEDLPPPHGVPGNIACIPVNDDFAPVHRVSNPILRVPIDEQGRPIHKGGQIISRSPLDSDLKARFLNSVSNVTLTVDLSKKNFPFPGLDRLMDSFVQGPVVQALG